MPDKENKQSPSKPKCTLSSWRLLDELETVPVQDLCQSVCCPTTKEVKESSPSESGTCVCDNDVSAPVTSSALDPQREESSRSVSSQEQKIPTCLTKSQAIEVEAMIDEIRICREIIRKLALEAMDILHPESSQQYKQKLQAQQEPIANTKVSSCELYENSEANPIKPAPQPKPTDFRQKSDCTEKKCEISESRKYSGSEGQSTIPIFPVPTPTLMKSPTLSRKSSDPIAQTAFQIIDSRLGQKVVEKKPCNYSCDGEQKQNIDCSCDETMNKNKPISCGCDGGKTKKPDCPCYETPQSKMDGKTVILETFGKTPSKCGCDDGEMKQNKENEKRKNKTDSRSCLEKTFGCKSRDTAPSSVVAACAKPRCAANTCTCHFPPAYSQYFDCTGHVSGNCHCDKNA